MTHTPPPARQALGVGLCLLAALATAGFLLFYKRAAPLGARPALVFCLLLLAAILNSALAFKPSARRALKFDRAWWRSALALGVMSVGGNLALGFSLPSLGPGGMSTLMQLQIFFVAIGAWLTLGERLNAALLLGAVIAAGGFTFFAWPDGGPGQLPIGSLLGAVLTSVCFAGMIVWTRAVVHGLDPVPLNAGRLWLSVLVLAAWPGLLGQVADLPSEAWWLMLGAAALGPFTGRLAVMYALRFINAADAKLWTMLSPVFAFLLMFLVYGALPSVRELGGAALIVTGVLLPAAWARVRARRRLKRVAC